MTRRIIVFDGDDTLWETQGLYSAAKSSFRDLMEKQGFPDALDSFDELDALRASSVFFIKTRFFETMLITYAKLCGLHQKPWSTSVESEIRALGFSVFAVPPKLYEDTLLTLRTLSTYSNLVLLTSGDEETQESKIKALGGVFEAFFSRIYITQRKTSDNFRQVLDDFSVPARRAWVVGNSVKSDMNPAIVLGMRCILVPRGSWRFEDEAPASPGITVVRSLTEATETILHEE